MRGYWLMKKVKKKKVIYYSGLGFLITAMMIIGTFALGIYLNRVDAATREILDKSEVSYVTSDNEINEEGLYVAYLEEELTSYVEEKKVSSITYEFSGESFYLELVVNKDKNDRISFEIVKIVDDKENVKARMNLKDVKSIEYRSDEVNGAKLLKIDAAYNSDYFVITEGTYYFLGQDIESISFKEGRFYYLTYNPDYRVLEEYQSCSKDVRKSIDGFNENHYYFKYGKINFLRDYYQKLSTKKYTVREKCAEFSEKK